MAERDGLPDPHIERMRDPKGVHSEAWGQTLEEMRMLADDRREDGWEVETMVAAHTDTVSRDMKDHDRFGLMHIIPNNHAETFREFYDGEAFTDYLLYANEVEAFMYAVIEWIDPDGERSLFMASRYDMARAKGMIESAFDEGVLYSHVKTIDGTTLAAIPYEEFEPFITPPGRQGE